MMITARVALERDNDVPNELLDTIGNLLSTLRTNPAHFGAIRIAPSRRMVSPLSIGLATMDSTI